MAQHMETDLVTVEIADRQVFALTQDGFVSLKRDRATLAQARRMLLEAAQYIAGLLAEPEGVGNPMVAPLPVATPHHPGLVLSVTKLCPVCSCLVVPTGADTLPAAEDHVPLVCSGCRKVFSDRAAWEASWGAAPPKPEGWRSLCGND